MQEKKAISLIVLVITVIVMIILAGTIILTITSNGIIDKANEAVEKANLKQIEQIATLGWTEAFLKETTETKNNAYYGREVTNYLKSSGVTEEQLNKYTITATESGVSVKAKSGNTLEAPTITVKDNTLMITANDTNAEKYNVYVDGVLKTTVKKNDFVVDTTNLSTIGTATLSQDGTAYLSGCWQWKETVAPTDEDIYETVNFRFSRHGIKTGEVIKIWTNYYDGTVDGPHMCAYGLDVEESTGMFDGGSYYTGYETRLIDFGSTPQPVSKEFYDYVVENATATNWEIHFIEEAGMWKWNDTLEVLQEETVYLNASVVVNGIQYIQAAVGSVDSIFGCVLGNENGDAVVTYMDGYGWLDGTFNIETMDPNTIVTSDIYQIWDFGNTIQYVDKKGYNYLVSNAKQITTVDLTSLNLGEATHNITVKAVANGYTDSTESNVVNI